MKKNLRTPPENLKFADLFQFFWNHGLGNKLDNDDDPTPWTDASLAEAFDAQGKDISLRTVQHWKSGKFLPSRKNIHIIAKIIADGDETAKQIWADALIKALSASKSAKSSKPEISDRQIELAHIQPIRQDTRPFFLTGLAALALGFLSITYFIFRTPPSPSLAIGSILHETGSSSDTAYFQSLMTDINTSLVKSSDLEILSRREVKLAESSIQSASAGSDLLDIFKQQYEIQYVLNGESRTEGAFEYLDLSLINTKNAHMEWTQTFNLQSTTRFDIYRDTVEGVSQALKLENIPSLDKQNLYLGTDNEDAYTEYLAGRQNLKFWHETRNGPEIWRANAAFDRALKLDPEMGLAYFHKADAYYHQAAGDLGQIQRDQNYGSYIPNTDRAAVNAIMEMMSRAARHSHSKEAIAQAKINEIYYSEDWTDLRKWGQEFVVQATAERGELEWFFEPVIMLFLNEPELSENLLRNRIMKYDPLNGTGHAYLTRLRLISNNSAAARQTLEDAESATFSGRLAEVKGYLLFFEGNGDLLYDHVKVSENLSATHRDYFMAMSTFLQGNPSEAKIRLNSSEALKSEKVHLAYGLHHIGEAEEALQAFNEIANTPMGPVLLSVAMSYGVACGPTPLPDIDVLREKMRHANIDDLPCIGAPN